MTLTVNGSGFGYNAASLQACGDCGGATVLTWTDTVITGTVNTVSAAPYNTIFVETETGNYSNSVSYTPIAPTVSSVQVGTCIYNVSSPPPTPCSIGVGSFVTINGNYFGTGVGRTSGSEVAMCVCQLNATINSWSNQQITVTATQVAMNSGVSVGLVGSGLPWTTPVPYNAINTAIPTSFFGIHVNHPTTALPPMGWFGTQRLWNTQTNWPQIETTPQINISAVQRSSGYSTITVSFLPGYPYTGWKPASGAYVYVNGLPSNCNSFDGLYLITGVTSTTISYAQSGTVNSTGCNGTANFFTFAVLDNWLKNAKTQGMDVIYTFGKVPTFPGYSSQPAAACSTATNPLPDGTSTNPGECFPPSDLGSLGNGTNQRWRTFVTGLAQHLAWLNANYSNTYTIPAYFEAWNEFDQSALWVGNYPALVRLVDDLACIVKGPPVVITGGMSCAADPNFIAKGVLPTAKILQPSLSSVSGLDKWTEPTGAPGYYQATGATANADIISVHTYRYGNYIQSLGCTGCGIVRSNNTVTVTTAHPNGVSYPPGGGLVNGFGVNSVVLISGVSPSSFNGTFTIATAPGASNKFTFAQTGNNETGTGGTAQNGPDQLKQALANFVATLTTVDQAKPLWVTEGAWGVPTTSPATTDPFTQQGYAMRWFAILSSAGVARAYWYGWDLGGGTGVMWNLTSGDRCDGLGTPSYTCGPPPPPGFLNLDALAYEIGQTWTLGNSMTTGCTNTGTVWTCGFIKPDSTKELMVWDSAQDNYLQTTLPTHSNYPIPPGYTAYYDATGSKYAGFSTGQNVPIGAIPILLVP
jgi:hypothetical protein